MRTQFSHRSIRALLLTVGVCALSIGFLQGIHLLDSARFSWQTVATQCLFVLTVAFLSWATMSHRGRSGGPGRRRSWLALTVGIIGLGVGVFYAANGTTWAAWIMLVCWYVASLNVEEQLTDGNAGVGLWLVRGLIVLFTVSIPIGLDQIESRFSDEEFFVVLQVPVLSILWLLSLTVRTQLTHPTSEGARECSISGSGCQVVGKCGLAAGIIAVAILAELYVVVRSYQHSFYPAEAPSYPGISRTTPFLCGEVKPNSQTFDGKEVFQHLLALVESKPSKGPPEYGMLALATGERQWAEAFRESLLEEATEGRFTAPSNSIKSTQYEAAFRVYYFARVDAAFPGLFSEEESHQVRQWFAAVNRRAWTSEWVDWMYGIAFSKRPEGPYENQENGAGLLALLEVAGLGDSSLVLANQGYLARNRRGWEARFRVTDDALVYQALWINNAYFQSLYTGRANSLNKRLSLKWLLAQALPDGAPFGYNHPASASLAGIAYAGASWLRDPQYVWVAGRAMEALDHMGRSFSAQPGVEEPVTLEGRSPVLGSCLLYGDSGLPNQIGPLAPDKIVMRDGWEPDSAYLLLNLRFTGWHRYKATNTVTLIYQSGPLVADVMEHKMFTWLPRGRSLFRDKRIPRENMNGLVVEKTGMAAVLYGLTGIGSPWSQDPPYYAEVLAFETSTEVDRVHVQMPSWHRWQHDRWIYFYHGGPIVVIDSADGPPGKQAALAWHLTDSIGVDGERVLLRGGGQPAEVLFWPFGNSKGHLEVVSEGVGDLGSDVLYYASPDGRIRLVSAFLLGEWVGAEAQLEEGKPVLTIKGPEKLAIPLDSSLGESDAIEQSQADREVP